REGVLFRVRARIWSGDPGDRRERGTAGGTLARCLVPLPVVVRARRRVGPRVAAVAAVGQVRAPAEVRRLEAAPAAVRADPGRVRAAAAPVPGARARAARPVGGAARRGLGPPAPAALGATTVVGPHAGVVGAASARPVRVPPVDAATTMPAG